MHPRRALVAVLASVALLAAALTPGRATAGTLDVVNEVRRSGCGRDGAAPLRRSAQLESAAARMARGDSLHDALERAGYRADQALSIHVGGGADDAALRRILAQRFCRDLANPAVRQAGLVRDSRDLWLVLAAPFDPPSPRDARAVARRALALVNEARARPRRCGSRSFPAAPPLTLSATLGVAALAHSREMAATEKFAHQGADGSTPATRVQRTGYRYSIVGENIAAGPATAEEVVQGWLDSPPHCENVMNARFTEMGLAYAVDTKSRSGIYWTQVFATPR